MIFGPGKNLCLFVLAVLVQLVLFFPAMSRGYPIAIPQNVEGDMRQIPQWHCLRYRKFDLIKRCRNYRVVRRQRK